MTLSPVPIRSPDAPADTAADRAKRLADLARSAGAEAVHDLIVALSAARTEAEAVAELASIPAGQREVATRAAQAIRAHIDTLRALIGRA